MPRVLSIQLGRGAWLDDPRAAVWYCSECLMRTKPADGIRGGALPKAHDKCHGSMWLPLNTVAAQLDAACGLDSAMTHRVDYQQHVAYDAVEKAIRDYGFKRLSYSVAEKVAVVVRRAICASGSFHDVYVGHEMSLHGRPEPVCTAAVAYANGPLHPELFTIRYRWDQ